MTSQIDEGQQFRTVIANFFSRSSLFVIYNLATRIEAQNVMADRTCSTRLKFMFMTKHVKPGQATAVVQLALRQHAD